MQCTAPALHAQKGLDISLSSQTAACSSSAVQNYIILVLYKYAGGWIQNFALTGMSEMSVMWFFS